MATTKRDQVNIDFTRYPELLKALEEMAQDDDLKLGPFVRKLVKQEKARRQQLPSPTNKLNRRKNDQRTAQAVAA